MPHIDVKKRLGAFFALMVICLALASHASAEIIDEITLHTDANGEIDAVVKFIVPIQYVRHFPQHKSPYVAIFFNILNTVPRDEWIDYESHRSPPSDTITGFTITTRDLNTGPKIQLQFDKPAEYEVSAGKSGRSILIHIKPAILNKAQSGAGSAVVAASSLAQATTLAKPVVPLAGIALAGASAKPVPAVPLAQPAAAPVQKPVLAAAPAPQSAVAAAPVQKPAVAPTPPSAVAVVPIPAMAVAAIPLPLVAPTQQAAAAPVQKSVVAVAPSPQSAVAAAVPTSQPAVVAVPVPLPTVAAAPTPQPVVAAVAVAPPAVAQTKPAAIQPAAKPTIIASRLGGKDGLPLFPDIELPAPGVASIAPPESPTLADQVKNANDLAAVQMAKGQDALLAGQMYAAVEAFNNTLNLPPNKYSQDAQIWIGIAKEKSGQPAKARLEYESYLKLYPNGAASAWAKDRVAKLNLILPAQVTPLAVKPAAPDAELSAFHTTGFGSLSSYYYNGKSRIDTISTVGGIQTPTTLTTNDQSALFTNVMTSVRSYNNEFDNRLVFQDMYAKNFLPNGQDRNRLNAAYAEVKNRVDNYSLRVGRQSAYGGGVMGRFDGITAGYGFSPDWRVNVVGGQLSDQTIGDQPRFAGASVDFGVKSAIGGSFYFINQTVAGILDRQAAGGIVRYFEPRRTAFTMIDYDTQFKQLNMLTVQGTLSSESGMDYNFLLDRRRSPSLSIRNAVIGTTASVQTLLDNGWTTDDLLTLADQRTPTSSMAMFGVTNHLSEKWQLGTDVTLSNTTGLQASGTLNPDFTTGLEGFVPATPSTGNAWTITERLTGNNVIASHDLTMFSASLTQTDQMSGKSLLMYNHAYLQDPWTLDSTLRLYLQNDSTGGSATTISPTAKAGYRLRTSLTLEAECGIDWTQNTPGGGLDSSQTVRQYFALGFRWDF